MRGSRAAFSVSLALLADTVFASNAAGSHCKCIPSDPCWPSTSEWSTFNTSISGRLLRNSPVAAPCYPLAANADSAACKNVVAGWNNSDFQSNFPLGHAYPYEGTRVTCDIPGGNTTTCDLGDEPVYAVNVSSVSHVVSAVKFAKKRNLRVVIKTTGHDLLGRSNGFGSLEIWLKYLNNGIKFEKTYRPTNQCYANSWKGAAMNLDGAYKWSSIYEVAAANNAIVVGGGNPDVGWPGYLQGGGHSPASSQFGLGADQVLEANVVLADGRTVLASACENPDLLRAIRGGGGGYGVVTSIKIKAYPDASVSQVVLSVTGRLDGTAAFLSAVGKVLQAAPALIDGGLSGYGTWALTALGPAPTLQLSLAGFNKTSAQVKAIAKPLADALAPFMNNPSSSVNVTLLYPPSYPNYSSFYAKNHDGVVSSSYGGLMTSRFVGKSHLANTESLASMLKVTAGAPIEGAVNVLEFVAGGAVKSGPHDRQLDGVNPAWRNAYLVNIVARAWPPTSPYEVTQAIKHDVTYVKGGALETFAPNTGGYVNEGNPLDPEYLKNFYGGALGGHLSAKRKYDPEGLFYCNVCVGSDSWTLDDNGRLCEIKK